MTRNEYLAEWRLKNKEKLRTYQKEYMRKRRADNPERERESGRKLAASRRAANPDKARKYDREYYQIRKNKDPEKIKLKAAIQRDRHRLKIREVAKKWAKLNKGKKNHETAKRRAAIIMAMPKWADKEKIRMIYEDCSRITLETGIQHHVDHIEPLRGEKTCGLHVEYNLQIITATANQIKSNKLAVF